MKKASFVFIIISILVIAGFNYTIIAEWFGKNGPANLGSIEVSYVSMGRFLRDFGFASWAPFWYFGFPFHLFYTPLLPFLEFFINKLFAIPLWQSYRLITGVAFMIGPISLFFLCLSLSKRVSASFIAAMFYSIGPSVIYFIAPEVAADRFSKEFLDPRRFTVLVRWGEGPHLFSLMFVPLVGLFFVRLLRKKDLESLILTSLFLGLAGLTNAIGLFASILLIATAAFAYGATSGEVKSAVFNAFKTGVLALLLISFWYNLSFITSFFGEGGGTSRMLLSLFPWGWVGGLVGIVVVYFFIKKVIRDFALSFCLLWFLIFFAVVVTYYVSAVSGDSSSRIELLPQALRYNVEVDLSFSLLVGILFANVVGFLEKRMRRLKFIEVALALFITVVFFVYAQDFFETSQKATSVSIDLAKTSEAKIAKWLLTHVDQSKGERVFLPGNYGFYLNWFSNISQHRGGLFQAATNKWPDHMHYQMANGKNADIAKAWLTIANAKYAVVTTPESSEIYKEIKNLNRFDSFDIMYSKDGDIIYKVPLVRPSLTKPIRLADLSTLLPPIKGDDKKNLLAYSDWVSNSSTHNTSLFVLNHDTYQITGAIGEGEGLLVQMTADSGWSAVDASTGKNIQTGKDPMGFLLLYPDPGTLSIILSHHKTIDEWVGYMISIVTIGFVGFRFFFFKKTK